MHFFHISTSKSGLSPSGFNTFDFQILCASGHNGVHFFDSLPSKSGLRPSGFNTLTSKFYVLRTTTACIFSTAHLPKVVWDRQFLTLLTSKFYVLRATTACIFSTAQLPNALRMWGVFTLFTWKCASRHNGAHFFISHLASWLRTRRFSEVTFRPPATFLLFRTPASFSFSLFLLSDFLSSSLLLSDSFHICFSPAHIAGSFTSKLPSAINHSSIGGMFTNLAIVWGPTLWHPVAHSALNLDDFGARHSSSWKKRVMASWFSTTPIANIWKGSILWSWPHTDGCWRPNDCECGQWRGGSLQRGLCGGTGWGWGKPYTGDVVCY